MNVTSKDSNLVMFLHLTAVRKRYINVFFSFIYMFWVPTVYNHKNVSDFTEIFPTDINLSAYSFCYQKHKSRSVVE